MPRRRYCHVNVCLQLRQGEGAAKRSANTLLRRGDRNRPVVRTEGDGVCRSSKVLEPNSRWVARSNRRLLQIHGRVQSGGVPLRPGRPLPQRVLRQPRSPGERAGRLRRRERTVTRARPSDVSRVEMNKRQTTTTDKAFASRAFRNSIVVLVAGRRRRRRCVVVEAGRRARASRCGALLAHAAAAPGRADQLGVRARRRARVRRPCPHAGAARFNELGRRNPRRRARARRRERRCTLPPQRLDVCAARIFSRRHWRAAASAAAVSEFTRRCGAPTSASLRSACTAAASALLWRNSAELSSRAARRFLTSCNCLRETPSSN